MGHQPWWKVLKKDIFIYTFDFNFGIVVPCPSGFQWGQQTNGVACNQVAIEGIYIPLSQPAEILKGLVNANYQYNQKFIARYWKQLKKFLTDQGLEFEEVDAPKGMPKNQEALQWIKIKKWHSHIDSRDLLEGEIVALYYPNCD